ncbi:ragulator complex protein LAMTOR5-like [Aethina tumida]|uniref:ragulator complex protein LAMTOR5-like n=1 Tax=Aethina tumida TaxID=116153 RepID=UPI00096B3085|nr:ragulator complex protein LAMTOR5-like [Aethina tumida]
MEKHLNRVMEEINNQPGVYGCVLSDHQGLCLGAQGKASTDSSGIISAIAEQAAKLEPRNVMPIICLENDNRQIIIRRHGVVTCAIYKNVNN